MRPILTHHVTIKKRVGDFDWTSVCQSPSRWPWLPLLPLVMPSFASIPTLSVFRSMGVSWLWSQLAYQMNQLTIWWKMGFSTSQWPSSRCLFWIFGLSSMKLFIVNISKGELSVCWCSMLFWLLWPSLSLKRPATSSHLRNIFIGVIGEEYSRLKDQAQTGFRQIRAKLCLEYMLRKQFFRVDWCSKSMTKILLLSLGFDGECVLH